MLDLLIKLTKNIFLVFLSILGTSLLLTLVVSIVATVFSGSIISNTLIGFGLFFFLPLIIKYFYYTAFIAISFLYLEKFSFFKKYKIRFFSGVIFFLVIATVWSSAFIFYYSKEKFYNFFNEDSWKSKIQTTQFLDKEKKKDLSETLCATIKDKWSPKDRDWKSTVQHINDIATEIDLKIATENNYIERGHITYYFEPEEQNADIDSLISNANDILSQNGFGPTFYWLNREWYNQNWAGKSIHRYEMAKYEEPYIHLKFETLNPVLNDYVTKGILKSPPKHLLDLTKEANLKYIKSERIDSTSYTYSTPVPFFVQNGFFGGIAGGHYNVMFKLVGQKSKNSYKLVELDNVSCNWPRYGLKGNRPGHPQSKKINYPQLPVEIPSCSEYRQWSRCKEGAKKKYCEKYPQGLSPPKCPPLVVEFSIEEYS